MKLVIMTEDLADMLNQYGDEQYDYVILGDTDSFEDEAELVSAIEEGIDILEEIENDPVAETEIIFDPDVFEQ